MVPILLNNQALDRWMILFQNCVRQSRSPTKMATTVRCYWKQLWSRWAITGSWEPLVFETAHIWKLYIIFILHSILIQLFSLNWLWELVIICRYKCRYPLISYCFWDELNWKGTKTSIKEMSYFCMATKKIHCITLSLFLVCRHNRFLAITD